MNLLRKLDEKSKLKGNAWSHYAMAVPGSGTKLPASVTMDQVHTANEEWRKSGDDTKRKVVVVRRDESSAAVLAVQERLHARGVPLPPTARSALQNLLVSLYCQSNYNIESFFASYIDKREAGKMSPLPSFRWLAKVLYGVSSDYYNNKGEYHKEKADYKAQFTLAGMPVPFTGK